MNILHNERLSRSSDYLHGIASFCFHTRDIISESCFPTRTRRVSACARAYIYASGASHFRGECIARENAQERAGCSLISTTADVFPLEPRKMRNRRNMRTANAWLSCTSKRFLIWSSFRKKSQHNFRQKESRLLRECALNVIYTIYWSRSGLNQ